MELFFPCVIVPAMVIGFFIICWKYVDWRNEKINEKVKKRVAEMSEKEKQNLLWGDSWKYANGSLPKTCPKCYAENYSNNSIGYPTSKWILISTETVEVEKLDKAYRLGGATTVFTKNETKEKKTYKCPKCGYIHKVS